MFGIIDVLCYVLPVINVLVPTMYPPKSEFTLVNLIGNIEGLSVRLQLEMTQMSEARADSLSSITDPAILIPYRFRHPSSQLSFLTGTTCMFWRGTY